MSIKIDLEKAYDKPSWDFINDTLIATGIPSNLRRVIQQCIMTALMQVLWNGELTESFKMGRRIRQGCPLSLYIFVLCIERLSHLISSVVGEGVWRPIRVGRHGPPISQLMFANDLLLFSEASMEQVQVIKNVLDAFCAVSGQKELYLGTLGLSEEASLSRLGDPYTGCGQGLLGSMMTQAAIARAWNQVSKGATWAICRGDRARFWEDMWIPNCRPLLYLSQREVPPDLRGRPVMEFVDVNGSWNWNVFSDWLDHSSMLKVATVVPPKASMETASCVGRRMLSARFQSHPLICCSV
ncbi:hypothetical protein CRG98_039485 [Punica granatum]|uniref:Reverse transcriptase domain-containing protein n=1 Tax=Punica granatum TaxID=22663 RepID=A0A2I0I8J0_PUNGR|nr:hypothetical protein CRG98_039485 [Punica granatum]